MLVLTLVITSTGFQRDALVPAPVIDVFLSLRLVLHVDTNVLKLVFQIVNLCELLYEEN